MGTVDWEDAEEESRNRELDEEIYTDTPNTI
jgi:hypothetical protein